MSRYTETEERQFEASKQGKNIGACVDQAVVQVAQDAKDAGFGHPVLSTFTVSVRHHDGEFLAEASTVYSRIVPTIGNRGGVRPSKPETTDPVEEPEPIDELSEMN